MNIPNMSNMGINPNDIVKSVEGKIHYPATKDQIIGVINDIPDIPQPARQFVESKLPEGNYKSLDDIKRAIHM